MSGLSILCIGDVHAKSHNFQDIDLLHDKLEGILKETKPDKIVLLGDLANDFEKMHIVAWRSVCKIMLMLRKYAHVYYVVGNHDYLNNSCFLTDEHFFNIFKELGPTDDMHKIHIIDKPTLINFPLYGDTDKHNTYTVHDIPLVFCPYVFPGRFKEALDTIDGWRGAHAIFCHQEIRGAKMGAIESTVGDEWESGLPPLYIGHVHDRQTIGDNVTFIGTPYHTAFGESGDKSVSLLNFTPGSITEKIISTGMPRRITKTIVANEFSDLEIDPNTRSRVVVTGTTEEITKIKNSKKYKELSEIAKIILKPSDKVVVVERGTTDYNYLSILQKSIESESDRVKKVFEEVSRNVASHT